MARKQSAGSSLVKMVLMLKELEFMAANPVMTLIEMMLSRSSLFLSLKFYALALVLHLLFASLLIVFWDWKKLSDIPCSSTLSPDGGFHLVFNCLRDLRIQDRGLFLKTGLDIVTCNIDKNLHKMLTAHPWSFLISTLCWKMQYTF